MLVFQLLIDMSKNKLGNKLSEERKNRMDCLYLRNFLLSLFSHIWQRHYHVADLKKIKYFLIWELHTNKGIFHPKVKNILSFSECWMVWIRWKVWVSKYLIIIISLILMMTRGSLGETGISKRRLDGIIVCSQRG